MAGNTIRVRDREFPVDADGVIDMPFRTDSMRYSHNDELREFRIEWYSGQQGVPRFKVSRVVIRRIARNAYRPAKQAAQINQENGTWQK